MSAHGPVTPPTGGTPQTQQQARAMVRTFLTEEQERIWFGLTQTYDALLGALDARMLAEHNMPLSAFEALMHITHAEEGAISISDLAELVRLSPSQVSRIAIDLERRGLVQRHRSQNDSRSTEVAVTESGRAQLQAAAPTRADRNATKPSQPRRGRAFAPDRVSSEARLTAGQPSDPLIPNLRSPAGSRRSPTAVRPRIRAEQERSRWSVSGSW